MHVHVPLVAFRTRSKQLTKRIVGNLLEGDFQIPSLEQADLETCPLCETRIVQTPKVYTCESGRDCDWFLSREISGKAITPDILKSMLAGEAPLEA